MVDVKTLCLGQLLDGEASGYEIKKALTEGPLGLIQEASYGSIYPALNRLSESGYVAFRTEELDGRPDKKIYTITPEGRAYLLDQVAALQAEDKIRSDFLFSVLFSDQMSPQRVRDLIDLQIAQYRRRQHSIESLLQEPRPEGKAAWKDGVVRFAVGYGQAICAAVIRHLETNRHLIEESPVTPTADVRKSHG